MNYRPTGVKFSGVTTMYGNDDNGTSTASGRRFDENEFTCAHKTLPFGTRLAVSKNGKSVIVTVTDRGPFTPGGCLIYRGARRDTWVSTASAGSPSRSSSPSARSTLYGVCVNLLHR